MTKKPNLIVIVGPTGAGKTSLAIELAKKLNADIVSADSRQIYKEIPIGTAAPSASQLKSAKHHFVGTLSVTDYYNVSMFESDVLKLLETYFKEKKTMIMVGGSGLYIDAVCKGIDALPDADEDLRGELNDFFSKEGIEGLRKKLELLDPVYYNTVDLDNPKRLLRAIEVCLLTGMPFSQQRKGKKAERPFNIIKIGLELPRGQLYEIIESRLSVMLNDNWLEEARTVFGFRNENALNTVGYKELFKFLNGEWDLETAKEKIKVNTRRYAKRQMTWFKRDNEINWFSPDDRKDIFDFVAKNIRPL
ncbi:MAG: tRNA (adenosine(37)-N6)-dimethylallyltransferase MiaA [Chlorobi bacterium]|nr:tRNA (adenosine(37)-N6)-dimethylallyltransferase MiaA [Chlorobiota bacterium]